MEETELLSAGALSYADEESVCGGVDSRSHIWETGTVPYYYACQLLVTFAHGTFLGSAFPIIRNNKRVVLATSAHCVFAMNEYASKILVTPARNGDRAPFGSYQVCRSKLRASAQWINGGYERQLYDYGAIFLPADANINVIPIARMSDEQLTGRLVNNMGYPADKHTKDPHSLWWSGGPIERVESHMFYYMNDTYQGQSGGPVYTWASDNTLRAIGIHGYGDCPNRAVRFTEDVIRDFQTWAES